MRLVPFLLMLALAPAVHGQTLIERYQAARFQAEAERILEEQGIRPAVRPVAHVASTADTVWAWITAHNPELLPPPVAIEPEPEPFQVSSWRLIRRLERGWFEKEYAEAVWTFIGANNLTPLDTTFTRDLRARLQAHFGDPTMTLTELDFERGVRREEYIQFEYWFVLDGDIPLRVMDVNGPFERGLVVATDVRHRALLRDIKQGFLGRVMEGDERAPFVDYYYLIDQKLWYRTGFDGREFFMRRIQRPDLKLGRPVIAGTEE